MGRNKNIDTTAFRHAIWHYVHCIYGVRHDDYNYGVINDLLEKNVRSFIKLISCFPENTTRKDYRHFMTEFMQSEKVSHINRQTLILLTWLFSLYHYCQTLHVQVTVDSVCVCCCCVGPCDHSVNGSATAGRAAVQSVCHLA